MSIVKLTIATGVIALGLSSVVHAEATWERLEQANSANDMTPDGQLIVGQHISGQGYYWTRDDGYTLIGGWGAVAVSDDGSVIFGQIEDPKNPGHPVAAVWTEATGWESLGGFAGGGLCPSVSSAYELSAAGDVGVGLGWVDGCDAVAMRWTPDTGIVAMDVLGNGGNRASVVSADGQLAAGFAQGSFSRTPAIWFADGSGMLLDPQGDAVGEVRGMTEDGSVLFGNWNEESFMWTAETGVTLLGTHISSYVGAVMDATADGTLVGFDYSGLSRVAWIRPVEEGDFVRLTSYLIQNGASGVPLLQVAQAITDDGRIVIGHDTSGAWIATLFTSCPGDVDGSGDVGFNDVLTVLASWGPCEDCAADIDSDGDVGFTDLLTVLAAWGACPAT